MEGFWIVYAAGAVMTLAHLWTLRNRGQDAATGAAMGVAALFWPAFVVYVAMRR